MSHLQKVTHEFPIMADNQGHMKLLIQLATTMK